MATRVHTSDGTHDYSTWQAFWVPTVIGERLDSRNDWVEAVAREVGARSLWWIGPRGADAVGLADVPQFAGTVSLTAALPGRPSICVENRSGHRVDIDDYDPADEMTASAEAIMWSALDGVLDRPTALLPYRGYDELTLRRFTRRSTTTMLGPFPPLLAVMECKPHVETEMARLGLRVLPWQYVTRADLTCLARDLETGPAVFRPAQTSGGHGFFVAHDLEGLIDAWREDGPEMLATSGFLRDAVSLNVSGVVWSSTTTLHPASIQLIGVPGLTSRQFGYCGSDFAAIGDLGLDVLDDLDLMARQVGDWLRCHGYRGVFGMDALWHDDQLHFVEVNPRFQGSTVASAMLSAALDLPCTYLEHLGVFLGLAPPASRRLRDMWSDAPPLSTFTVHNVDVVSTRSCPGLAAAFDDHPSRRAIDLLPDPTTSVAPGGALARVFVDASVTTNGADLDGTWRSRLDRWGGSAAKVSA